MDGIYTLRFLGNATISFPVSTATLLNYSHNAATDVTLAYINVPKAGNGQLWLGFEDAHMTGGVAGGKNISLLQVCKGDLLHIYTRLEDRVVITVWYVGTDHRDLFIPFVLAAADRCGRHSSACVPL